MKVILVKTDTDIVPIAIDDISSYSPYPEGCDIWLRSGKKVTSLNRLSRIYRGEKSHPQVYPTIHELLAKPRWMS